MCAASGSGWPLAGGEFGRVGERCYNRVHSLGRGSIVRPNAHDWKSCEGHTSAGSNPALSARVFVRRRQREKRLRRAFLGACVYPSPVLPPCTRCAAGPRHVIIQGGVASVRCCFPGLTPALSLLRFDEAAGQETAQHREVLGGQVVAGAGIKEHVCAGREFVIRYIEDHS